MARADQAYVARVRERPKVQEALEGRRVELTVAGTSAASAHRGPELIAAGHAPRAPTHRGRLNRMTAANA